MPTLEKLSPPELVLDESMPEPVQPPAPPRAVVPEVTLGELWQTLRGPAPVLLAGLALLGLAFTTEATAAWRVWMDSTAYSHCFFVLPIALYLAWDRRANIVAAEVVYFPWAAAAVMPLGIAWLVAERLGIMEGRQLVALSIVEVLFLAVLGWRMARALAAPLLYLYFLVPFGAFLTPVLQDWTAAFSVFGLEVLEIPHYADHYLIEIPEGRFYVAEACAGLRFLIASIAFGVLYACLMYRDMSRRILFVLASIVVPIVANWFRALGIVVLGHILGSAEAAAADHIIYGWLFFSVVTLLLILAGLPFRQDLAPPPPRSKAMTLPVGGALKLVAAVVVLAWIGPAISAGLDRAAQVSLPAPGFAWTTPLGCRAGPVASVSGSETVRFLCPQGAITATAQIFPPRVNPAAIGAAQRRLTGEQTAEDVTSGTLETPELPLTSWRLTIAGAPRPVGTIATATAVWLDGAPALSGLAGRIAMARNSIFGAPTAPVLLSVSVRSQQPQIGMQEERLMRLLMTTFLQVQSELPAELTRLSGLAGK